MILCIGTLINYLLKKNNKTIFIMRRSINIMKNIKVIPSFKLQTNKGEEKEKYHSDIEKKKKIKKEVDKNEIKYFISL